MAAKLEILIGTLRPTKHDAFTSCLALLAVWNPATGNFSAVSVTIPSFEGGASRLEVTQRLAEWLQELRPHVIS